MPPSMSRRSPIRGSIRRGVGMETEMGMPQIRWMP